MRIDFFLPIFLTFRSFLVCIFLFFKRLIKINVSSLILIFLIFNFILDVRVIFWRIYNSTLDSAEINSLSVTNDLTCSGNMFALNATLTANITAANPTITNPVLGTVTKAECN